MVWPSEMQFLPETGIFTINYNTQTLTKIENYETDYRRY